MRRENIVCIEPNMCPQQPGFKFGGSRHLGAMQKRVYHDRKFDAVVSWSRRSCWSDAHCHGASVITASDNGNVVCSVSWIRMADTLNRRFTNCLYCKIIVVTDALLKTLNIFWSRACSTTFFANYQPRSTVLIHRKINVAPSSVLRFH